MSNRNRSLESRVAELEEKLDLVQRRLDALAEGELSRPPAEPVEATSADTTEDASEKVLAWVGQASLLPRLATICFLLVVALVLRTLTDGGVLAKDVGSWIGMGYAFALIGIGWAAYRRQHPLAPVFTVIGAILLYTVVVETHEHFESLPTLPAYVLIALAGGMTAAIAHRYRVALPLFVGSLGMALAGVALDFPNPIFPYLFALLLIANLLATFATRLQRCSWLRWMLFAVTVAMAFVWSVRLGIFLGRSGAAGLPFSVAGFFPVVVVTAAVYGGIALLGVVGRITDRISRFDYALPSLNALWTILVARYAVNAGLGTETGLGIAALVASGLHLAVAVWLGRRKIEGAPGTNSFAVAAALLFVYGLPLVTGSELVALVAISAFAVILAVLARRWRSGGMRLTSYLVQVYACGSLALLLRHAEGTAPSAVGAVASAFLAALAFFHYFWARNNPPPLESVFFQRFDPEDRTAVLLLMASLAGAFFSFRVGIYQGLVHLQPGQDPSVPFSAAQTVLINAAAVVLMCLAFARRNKEIRNLAILLTVIGGAKVFFVDLFAMRGMSVVTSVLSFGLAASLESFALSRWQRIDQLRLSKWPPEEEENGSLVNDH